MPTILITGCARGLGLATATHLLSLPASHPSCPGTIFATYRHAPSAALQNLAPSTLTQSALSGREEADLEGRGGEDDMGARGEVGGGGRGKGDVGGRRESEMRVKRLVLVRLDDVTEVRDVERAREVVRGVLGGGGLDVLVNNAGVMQRCEGGVGELSPTDLLSVLATNVTGPHLVTKIFLPLLREGSQKKILNMSSTLGSIQLSPSHRFNCEAYKISKAALNALTVEWASQLADSGRILTAAGAEVGGGAEQAGNEEGWCVVAFSPGWLRTALGGPYAEFPVEHGAEAVVEFVRSMSKEMNGRFIADDGSFPPR